MLFFPPEKHSRKNASAVYRIPLVSNLSPSRLPDFISVNSSKYGRVHGEIPLRINSRCNKINSDGSISIVKWKHVAPIHDSVSCLGKSKISRRNTELTDASCMDIFCSVAIYDWRGWGVLTGTIYIELAPRCYLL